MPRVGYLAFPAPGESPVFESFRQGLREAGYVEGQTIVVEYRPAEGQGDRLPELAAELVGLKVDAIVAETFPAIRAARDATGTIPTVMAVSSDPVATGLVASLARPGGNVTGVTTLSTGLSAKRLELLKEIVPGVSEVAVLWAMVAAPDKEPGLRETQAAARALSLQVQTVEIRRPDDFDSALDVVAGGRAGAFVGLCDPVTLSRRKSFVDFEAKSRLPGIYETREYVDEGGLISYGASLAGLGRRSASFVDKILKGTKPAELPVEQPTTFELVVNLKAAQTLGLQIPQSVLGQATELLQ